MDKGKYLSQPFISILAYDRNQYPHDGRPYYIFGWWIFPHLGVSGAAVANIVSQSLGGAIGLWILFSGRSRLRLSLKNFRIDLNIIWRIVRIGLPALVSSIQRSFSQFLLMWFMAPFGTLAVAAHTINQRIEMMLFMPGMSFGMGAGDTLPPMVISLVTVWAVTLPLAYFLPRVTGLGVYGVRWAMVAGVVIPAVALTTYFKLGRWKRKRV